MQLYSSALSPFSRKVRILVLEKGLGDQVKVVNANPFEPTDAFLAANPLSKVPVLLSDDGESLYDSNVICEYLDGLSEPRLIPGGSSRIQALKQMALVDGLLQSTFSIVCELVRRPENERSATWVERWTHTLERCLDALAGEIPTFSGALSLPHIGAVCALDYLDLRVADRINWRERQPSIEPWYADYGERPAMLETRPS